MLQSNFYIFEISLCVLYLNIWQFYHYMYCICVSLQVFRLEDSRCLFTLYGHTTKITVLHADKVMITSLLKSSSKRVWVMITSLYKSSSLCSMNLHVHVLGFISLEICSVCYSLHHSMLSAAMLRESSDSGTSIPAPVSTRSKFMRLQWWPWPPLPDTWSARGWMIGCV